MFSIISKFLVDSVIRLDVVFMFQEYGTDSVYTTGIYTLVLLLIYYIYTSIIVITDLMLLSIITLTNSITDLTSYIN